MLDTKLIYLAKKKEQTYIIIYKVLGTPKIVPIVKPSFKKKLSLSQIATYNCLTHTNNNESCTSTSRLKLII